MAMKISKNFDGEALTIRLKQIGARAANHGAQALRDEADEIENIARMLAPVKTGNLESAIETEEARGDRRRIEVTVGLNVWETIRRNFNYGIAMHEGQEPYGSRYGLGKLSQEKADSTGAPVGGGFIARAIQIRMNTMRRAVRRAIQRGL